LLNAQFPRSSAILVLHAMRELVPADMPRHAS
jgi:hypothetical protein